MITHCQRWKRWTAPIATTFAGWRLVARKAMRQLHGLRWKNLAWWAFSITKDLLRHVHSTMDSSMAAGVRLRTRNLLPSRCPLWRYRNLLRQFQGHLRLQFRLHLLQVVPRFETWSTIGKWPRSQDVPIKFFTTLQVHGIPGFLFVVFCLNLVSFQVSHVLGAK